MNVERARKIREEMDYFLETYNNYTTKDLHTLVIKQYALTGSIKKVTEKLNVLEYPIEPDEVRDIIKSKPKDELHKIVRSYYMTKSKYSKSR